jgi:hypothetical protein
MAEATPAAIPLSRIFPRSLLLPEASHGVNFESWIDSRNPLLASFRSSATNIATGAGMLEIKSRKQHHPFGSRGHFKLVLANLPHRAIVRINLQDLKGIEPPSL